jgi:hypothetical protein
VNYLSEWRQDLANRLLVSIPTMRATYASPPAQVVAPCAVVAPRSPYVTRGTYGLLEVRLQVTFLWPHGEMSAAMDALDEIIPYLNFVFGGPLDEPRPGQGAPRDVVWESLDSIGQVTDVGGITYLSAVVNVTAHMEVEVS